MAQLDHENLRCCVPEAGIQGRDITLHSTDTVWCYNLSLSLKAVSSTLVLISYGTYYKWHSCVRGLILQAMICNSTPSK